MVLLSISLRIVHAAYFSYSSLQGKCMIPICNFFLKIIQTLLLCLLHDSRAV